MSVFRQFKSSYETDNVNLYIKFSVREYEWYVRKVIYNTTFYVPRYKVKTPYLHPMNVTLFLKG